MSAAQRTGSGLSTSSPAAHSPLLRAGNGDFWGLVDESCSITSTLKLSRETHEEAGDITKDIQRGQLGHPPGCDTPAPGRNAAPDAGDVPRRVRLSPLAGQRGLRAG